MTDLTAAWLVLAATAESQIAATAAAYEIGQIPTARFIETAAASVYAANLAATAYADTAVAAWRLARTGLPTPTLGLLPPPDQQDRLVRAFATIAAYTEAQSRAMSLTDRSRRVARSEPLDRGRRAYQEGLRARGATSWRRVVRPDACDDCAALAGDVHPIEVEFTDHTGCRCDLAPVVPEGWGEQVKARRLQLRSTYNTTAGQVRFSSGLSFR